VLWLQFKHSGQSLPKEVHAGYDAIATEYTEIADLYGLDIISKLFRAAEILAHYDGQL
jgi:hypothetical protein